MPEEPWQYWAIGKLRSPEDAKSALHIAIDKLYDEAERDGAELDPTTLRVSLFYTPETMAYHWRAEARNA